MTDTDKPSMKITSQSEDGVVDSVDNSPLEETLPEIKTVDVSDDKEKTSVAGSSENVVESSPKGPNQQSALTDFDHEATTKKLVSHLDPNMDEKADALSIASFEDVPPAGQAGSEKDSHFSDALNKVTLSVSPFIKYTIPYMETSTGRASKLKKFLSPELFWSAKFASQNQTQPPPSYREVIEEDSEPKSIDRCTRVSNRMCFRNPHPFTFSQLTHSANEDTTRAMLADFRARGGRIVPKSKYIFNSVGESPSHAPSTAESSSLVQSPEAIMPRRIDCLDMYSHQHIALQFSSYSHLSSNAPNHCVHPWVVTMEFYRRHDLTLGEFLEKFCFR